MATLACSRPRSVDRFIGVWQQESSQRPQRENGTTVRASGLIPHNPLPFDLWVQVPPSAFPNVTSANDTDYIKHVRLRSEKLSAFWGRDVFLEATVLLPYKGFDMMLDRCHRL